MREGGKEDIVREGGWTLREGGREGGHCEGGREDIAREEGRGRYLPDSLPLSLVC